MKENIQRLTLAQRRLVFFMIVVGGLFLLLGLTLLLLAGAFNASRSQGVALQPNVLLREFAQLPDDDAYPMAIAAASDGTLYTGSYATGAIWLIDGQGGVTEIGSTRETIGALAGLIVTADGSLIAVDHQDTDPRTVGGALWRISLTGDVVPFGQPPADGGWFAPNDLALDSLGRVYVSDAGRNEIWRFEPDGSGGSVWWVPPLREGDPRAALTGLAYDPVTDSIIISDPEVNRIYAAPVSGAQAEIVLYDHGDRPNAPGFDGLEVTPDGTIYVAALGQNGVAAVRENELIYTAGLFRGSSDIAFVAPNRLYVTNFDGSSLILPLLQPSLPFAIDQITLDMTPADES